MNDRQRASFGICVTESGLQSGCGFSLPNSTISFEICIRHNACCCRIEPARSVLCISNEKLTGALRIEAVRDSVRWFPAGAEQRRSLAVIDEVPRQLQNRNKQFAVSGIGPHARRRDYMGVVERLTDAGTADPRQPRSRADESLFPRYRSFGGSNERARPRILCRRRLRQGLRLTRRC